MGSEPFEEIQRFAAEIRRTDEQQPPAAGLQVGPANDPAEADADRRAARALAAIRSGSAALIPTPTSFGSERRVQRSGSAALIPTPTSFGSERRVQRSGSAALIPTPTSFGSERRVQRSAFSAGSAAGGVLDAESTGRIKRARTGGQPLDEPVRRTMERGYGTSFESVRIHLDGEPDRLNDQLQSHAFTTGSDVSVRRSAYAPDEPRGQHLTAHTLQQTGHSVARGDAPVTRRSMRTTIRRLSTTDKDAKNLTSHGVKLSLRSTMWTEIVEELRKYRKATNDPQAKLQALQALKVLATDWLAKHGDSTVELDKMKKTMAEKLRNECATELASMSSEAAEDYRDRLTKTYAGGTGGFQYISGDSMGAKVQALERDASGAVVKDDDGQEMSKTNYQPYGSTEFNDYFAHSGAKNRGLTKEEVAAIRIYSGGDYKTINPTYAESDTWLTDQVGKLSGSTGIAVEGGFAHAGTKAAIAHNSHKPNKLQMRQMKIDALRHGTMITAGAQKLPQTNTTLYRGGTYSKVTLDNEYGKGKRVVHAAFSSASLKLPIAEMFALSNKKADEALSNKKAGKAVSNKKADEAVSNKKADLAVVFKIANGRGYELGDVSIKEREGEVLFLPGAEFEVMDDATYDTKMEYWLVEMRHVTAAGAPAAAPSPSPAKAPPRPTTAPSSLPPGRPPPPTPQRRPLPPPPQRRPLPLPPPPPSPPPSSSSSSPQRRVLPPPPTGKK